MAADSSTTPKPGLKTLFEQQFDVPGIWQRLEAERQRLDGALFEAIEHRAEKRNLESQIENQQMALLMQEQVNNPSMSATAMREHIKVTYSTDQKLIDLLETLRDNQTVLDKCEADIQSASSAIKMLVAKLDSISAYLTAVSAVKLTS